MRRLRLRLAVLVALLLVVSGGRPPTTKLRGSQAPARTCTSEDSAALRLRGGCMAEVSRFSLQRLEESHPVVLAVLGTGFGWLMTALGAAAVVINRLGLAETLYRKVRTHTHPPEPSPEPSR